MSVVELVRVEHLPICSVPWAGVLHTTFSLAATDVATDHSRGPEYDRNYGMIG